MEKNLKRGLYLSQLVASVCLLGKCCQSYAKGWEGEEDGSIETELVMHRGMLSLVFIEIVLAGIGKIKGSLFKLLSLYAGQLVLCFVFLCSESLRSDYLPLAILLSLTETTKSANNLWQNVQPLSTLRYNLPLFTNVLISYFSLALLNDYMRIHAEVISYELINGIRLIQLGFIINAFVS